MDGDTNEIGHNFIDINFIALQELVRTFFNPKTLLQFTIPCSLAGSAIDVFYS